MKTRFKNIAMLAAIGVAGLVLAPQANATVQITLTNGASTVTVTDGGAGDACSAVNCVTFSGQLGNYLVNVSTGIAQNGSILFGFEFGELDDGTKRGPSDGQDQPDGLRVSVASV